MADRKKGKHKSRNDEDGDKPTKEEYSVAKYLRFNLPQKEAKLVGMTVKIFIASEAIDFLLESKWASGKGKPEETLFTNRSSVVNYLDQLLMKNLFHRAAKVEKKLKPKPRVKDMEEKDKEEQNGDDKEEKKSKVRERKSKKEREKETEEKKDSEKKDEKKDEKKKREKKLKLKMHDDQVFCDGDGVFVWIYDPVPAKTFIIGLLLVLGSIAICLFPLWPPEVRQGVYYLSLAAAVFVGFILVLVVVRFILFCAVWLFTMGKHHFWFLPNLTEDVGFMDSFRPLYKHDVVLRGDTTKDKKDTDKDNEKDEGESPKESKKSKKDENEKEGSSSEDYEIVNQEDVPVESKKEK